MQRITVEVVRAGGGFGRHHYADYAVTATGKRIRRQPIGGHLGPT